MVWQPAEDEGAALMESLVETIDSGQGQGQGQGTKVIKIDGIVVDSSNVNAFIADHPDSVK